MWIPSQWPPSSTWSLGLPFQALPLRSHLKPHPSGPPTPSHTSQCITLKTQPLRPCPPKTCPLAAFAPGPFSQWAIPSLGLLDTTHKALPLSDSHPCQWPRTMILHPALTVPEGPWWEVTAGGWFPVPPAAGQCHWGADWDPPVGSLLLWQ